MQYNQLQLNIDKFMKKIFFLQNILFRVFQMKKRFILRIFQVDSLILIYHIEKGYPL